MFFRELLELVPQLHPSRDMLEKLIREGATLIPALTSVLTKVIGPEAYMYVAGALGLIYAAFVGVRMTMREVPEPDPATEAHAIHEPPRY